MSYEEVYKKYYIRLPKIISISLGSLLAIIGLMDILASTNLLSESYDGIFSFFIGSTPYISGVISFIIWAFLSFSFAYLTKFILAIIVSQKIVVINRLTQIRDSIQK